MSMQQVPEWADPEVPEEALDAQGVSRRNLIRGAGLLGAGFAATAVGASDAAAAGAVRRTRVILSWSIWSAITMCTPVQP